LIGSGLGVSTLLEEEPEVVVVIRFPDDESEGVRVEEESTVDFLEIGAEVERESAGVVYGFGEDAKFLKDGSDMRGAFHGNRRIAMQLRLASS
jgi:hypothetical protein